MDGLPQKQIVRIKKIGDRLRELRVKAGFKSAEAFSNEHDIPRVQYGRIERGVNFKIATLIRVLEAHKITFEEFFKGLK
jgi:hypothetical protein